MLDVNVLIALAWPNHTHHAHAQAWFSGHHQRGWATTPVTEAGFVRLSSNRAAIATATTPAIARRLLGRMIKLNGHRFWVDDVAGVVGVGADNDTSAERLQSHRDVTDAHLLALAHRHGGRLVTFDARLLQLLGDRDPDLVDVQVPAH